MEVVQALEANTELYVEAKDNPTSLIVCRKSLAMIWRSDMGQADCKIGAKRVLEVHGVCVLDW